ncbi:hypothetical protein [Microbispora sp. CA-102843]|uniref:hypothetical protein n=1 Tax=Microbispora sp. CA-102843 TaxID=3239952 RepID=UPI003D92466A
MDLSADLRAAQAASAAADQTLVEARATLDGAARAYAKARRHAPRGRELERARQAWGLATAALALPSRSPR